MIDKRKHKDLSFLRRKFFVEIRRGFLKVKRLFTSESVGPGHPDKICDQISDAILDECLRRDPDSHVACECFITTQLLIIGGEITGNIGKIDYEAIARKTLRDIGYTSEEIGINADTCKIEVVIKAQSPDIAMGVNRANKEIGAGDQGLMFGYACKDTKCYMPLPIYLAHELVKKANQKRLSGEFKWALPDMKSQISIDYADYNHLRVDSVLISVQHRQDANDAEFKHYIKEVIIKEVIEENHLNTDYKVLVNPTGRFVVGGPAGDTGLTGRKIIVDTYGGYARHGGGAFSGKDPTKVDRSASYAARYIAKNIVAAGLADKIEIQLSYAIGVAEPTSVSFKTFHTAHVSDEVIEKAIYHCFKLTPRGIIEMLQLKRPIYLATSTYGHFGRDDLDLPWEKLDKVDELKRFLKDNA